MRAHRAQVRAMKLAKAALALEPTARLVRPETLEARTGLRGAVVGIVGKLDEDVQATLGHALREARTGLRLEQITRRHWGIVPG